jgi:hypothetical protein
MDDEGTRWWIAYGIDGSVIHDEVPGDTEQEAWDWAQSWADDFAEGCDRVAYVVEEKPDA